MKKKYQNEFICLLAILLSLKGFSQGIITGETNIDNSIKKWHRIEIAFNGPQVSESKSTFFDYKMDVTFTSPSNKIYKVPGFFDADGDPANTGATSGNIWKARFTAGEEGTWTYSVSFVTGPNIATELTGGTPGTAPDGYTGSFIIGPQDKSGLDFRAKGKLEYVNEHYLRFANGDYFIKCGADSPETFLGDIDFDGTTAVINSIGNVDHSPQIPDWKVGDPTWGVNKGKGIIGVINYLSSVGVNAHYFLCMNIEGDGKRSFPFINYNSPYVYDVSKLGQWEIVFSHFDTKGMMLHFVTSEIENAQYFEDLEGGSNSKPFSDARKVFYRELIARFGHHLAVTWNVGEENNATFSNGNDPNTTTQRKLFSERLRALTYYQDHIVVHNGGSGQDRALDVYTPLLGDQNFTGTSLQLPFGSTTTHGNIIYWRNQSIAANKKWVINYDEPFAGSTEVLKIDKLRKEVLWGTLSAGGAGVEWYLGGKDLSKNLNYRNFNEQYKVLGYAATFMNNNLAKDIFKMSSNDNLITNSTTNYALAEPGKTYLFYLKNGGNQSVNLSAGSGLTFNITWFNPKTGISYTGSSVKATTGFVSLGNPPTTTTSDWVALLKSNSTSSRYKANAKDADSNDLVIFPNPFQSSFKIEANSSENIIQSVLLFDAEGKSCKISSLASGNATTCTTENLPRGTYFVQIECNGKTFKKKIMKQ